MLFIIPKGIHRSSLIPTFTFSNKVKFRFKFDGSAIYDLKDKDQYDINKLYGLSDSWTYHKNDSARIGWRWNNITRLIDLFLYIHREGKIYSEHITSIEAGVFYTGEIKIEKDSYTGKIWKNDKMYKVTLYRNLDRTCYGLKYKLYPYFGGNKVAQQTIKILVTEL